MATVEQQAPEANPLAEGLERLPVHPTTLVIFGATGDLSKRKLLPAIYNIAHEGALPERFNLIGISRGDQTDEAFREIAFESIKQFSRRAPDETVLNGLVSRMRYVAGSFDDQSMYDRLAAVAKEFDEEADIQFNRLFYLSTAPNFFPVIAEALGAHGLGKHEDADFRIIIEKPFGTDLESALELNRRVLSVFSESQVFRIDHYLGKETVQNLLVLRFANGVFEPLWTRQFVDSVQITVAESIGVEGRGAFYDQTGALRDIFQNHLLQLLALVAMEPPLDFTAESVRNEKLKALRAVLTPGPKHVARGQYGPGVIDGVEVPGYREEPGVAPDSPTETFVAAKLYIDNWRWADTPFYLRTGKRLARRETTIAIQFKRAPHPPFEDATSDGLRPNVLLVHVQPDEGVSLAIAAKVPGQGLTLRTVHMDFLYGGAFRADMPEAYERLLLDCMRGEATLFTRADEVDEQWQLVDAIVAAWRRDR